ncbi:flagellar export chaperone FliS [Panacagrimonas sp.]|uniref:flagellar export chaperone FliS n=1 Tax=Panacagrimonas sp. TaxID=2480088 RepID=UPI003B520269
MGAMHRLQAIRQYRDSSVDAAMAAATPQQLVIMLLEGALDRIARARCAALGNERAARLAHIGAAISVLEYLKLCLDPAGGALSARLALLYDFCLRHLVQANTARDVVGALEEVAAVLRPIKQAWDELPAR